MNCVFCQIISQNGHAFKIYENDHVLAFLDIYPVSDGHTLIVTKKHFTHWTVTPDHLISEISKAVKPVVKILDQKLKPSGYNFLSNQGAIASQEVMHFHLHIVPKYDRAYGFLLHPERSRNRTVPEIFSIIKK